MIPERLKPRVERLGEIANRNDGTDVGDIALELASFMTEATFVEPGKGPSFSALAELETKVDARFVTHELAITELYRRLGPDTPAEEEPEATVFGIPVVLNEGHNPDTVRKAIESFGPGLDGPTTVARLEENGLLRRVGQPAANHTDVTVTPPRQGDETPTKGA